MFFLAVRLLALAGREASTQVRANPDLRWDIFAHTWDQGLASACLGHLSAIAGSKGMGNGVSFGSPLHADVFILQAISRWGRSCRFL